jgi:hypothetical protein
MRRHVLRIYMWEHMHSYLMGSISGFRAEASHLGATHSRNGAHGRCHLVMEGRSNPWQIQRLFQIFRFVAPKLESRASSHCLLWDLFPVTEATDQHFEQTFRFVVDVVKIWVTGQ